MIKYILKYGGIPYEKIVYDGNSSPYSIIGCKSSKSSLLTSAFVVLNQAIVVHFEIMPGIWLRGLLMLTSFPVQKQVTTVDHMACN